MIVIPTGRSSAGWSRIPERRSTICSHLTLLTLAGSICWGPRLGLRSGLYTAALDSRVAGLVAACGFAPLRQQRASKGTEGVRHYSHLHGLIPKFGDFEGHEDRLPVDYDEVLSLIAPRPLYVLAPTLDRYHPVDDVRVATGRRKKGLPPPWTGIESLRRYAARVQRF